MCPQEKHGGVVQRQGRVPLAVYGKVEGQNLLKSVARCEPDKDGPRAASAVGAADVDGVIQRVGFSGFQVYQGRVFPAQANAAASLPLAFPGQQIAILPGKPLGWSVGGHFSGSRMIRSKAVHTGSPEDREAHTDGLEDRAAPARVCGRRPPAPFPASPSAASGFASRCPAGPPRSD